MFYILRRRGLGLGSTNSIKTLSKHNITIMRNDKLPTFTDNDTVLRWGCTTPIEKAKEVLNSSSNISKVNNKRRFRFLLQQEGFSYIIPETWYDVEDPRITYPCILRPHTHAQGKYLEFCENYSQLKQHIDNSPAYTQYYISKYIPKTAEYRVCFIQGLVAWIAKKIPKNPEAIAWNVAQGGKFENVRWNDWPINVIETAYQASVVSGLYLCGIDVMVDANNNTYVLEVNSAPSHTSPYRKQCTTKCIDYGINKDNFYFLDPDNTYKKYNKWIHPALKENQNES